MLHPFWLWQGCFRISGWCLHSSIVASSKYPTAGDCLNSMLSRLTSGLTSKLIATNCLSCMHFNIARFSANVFFHTLYFACCRFSLQHLPAPRTTACNNFAFLSIFFMYHLSVILPPTDHWLINVVCVVFGT